MAGLFISLMIYLITVAIGYYGVREELRVKNSNPDSIDILLIFVPVANIVWGMMALTEVKDKKRLRKFFMLD